MAAPAQDGVGNVRTVGYLEAAPPERLVSAYKPQAGDIILYDDFNRFHHIVYKLAGTSAPTHVAMVIAKEDGSPTLLELTGPTVAFAKVSIVDVEHRFTSFGGVILVRRLKSPLGAEQSRNLREFAYAQQGKRFALLRVVAQATPFCPRHGLRHELFARTDLNRHRWFCSELVVAGCTTAGLLDQKICCANCTYPRDLAFDETIDLSPIYHPATLWRPDRQFTPAP
jgi:hypothetical protein